MNSPPRIALAVALYWSLPGPSRFTRELAHALDSASTLVVRIDVSEITGIHYALREALTSACPAPERIEFIDLDEGSHLESEVGHHFGRATMTSMELANWEGLPRTTIVLSPRSSRPRERARVYVREFMNELHQAHVPGVRLVLVWHSSDDALTPDAAQTIAFDGTLASDEMHAYVALRMIGQHGPGTTALSRHLVTEFAGGDPMLAEELIRLPEAQLLLLPASLSQAAHGCAIAGSSALGSTLADWHLSRAQGPSAMGATKRLDSKYWRACVRSLLPWLEERRRPVIEKLRPALEDYLYPTKGVWKKQVPWGNKVIEVAIEDLEFNDVVAMANYGGDPFDPGGVTDQALLRICRHAKRVRDALAHLRPPLVADVESVIREMDQSLSVTG